MPERVVRHMRHVAVAASLVVGDSPIAIADQAPPQDQRPTFRTEANYVRVDVYATTRDGTTINDLRREEFRLLEDRATGEPVTCLCSFSVSVALCETVALVALR